jgi:hypothetical protein
VRAIESAKKPETRTRRIDKALATLREQEAASGRAAAAKTRSTRSTRSHTSVGEREPLEEGVKESR